MVTINSRVGALFILPVKKDEDESQQIKQITEKVEEKQFSEKGINTNLEK